jgi:uncharacterized protein YajQ (UPF0234 family)
MPSFDVVSKVDWAEFGNAYCQAQKEIGQRFDFETPRLRSEKNEEGIVILANAVESLQRPRCSCSKRSWFKRKVSLKHLDKQEPSKGPRGTTRILVKLKEGIRNRKGEADRQNRQRIEDQGSGPRSTRTPCGSPARSAMTFRK